MLVHLCSSNENIVRLKLGLVTYNLARSWDLDTIIERCGAFGFASAKLRTTHAHGVDVTMTAAERAEVKARYRDPGLDQISLGSTREYHSVNRAKVEETK